MTDLTAPHVTDEDAARAYLERVRWPHGVTCPHCGVQHLHHYVAEFDLRYNNRPHAMLAGIEGKRLTYRRISGTQTN